jgi:hypothetical protein
MLSRHGCPHTKRVIREASDHGGRAICEIERHLSDDVANVDLQSSPSQALVSLGGCYYGI